MRATLALLTAVLSAGLVFSAPALADPDRTVKVDGAAPVAKWDGTPALGINQTFSLEPEVPIGTCGKLALNYCEETVVNAAIAAPGAKLKITVDGFGAVLPPAPAPSVFDDFDLYVYKSDAAGKVGDFIASGGEGAGTPEVVTVEKASGFYLARVVYFASLEAGYKGTAELIGAPAPLPALVPPGTTPPAPGATPAPSSTPAPGASPTPSPTPAPTSTGKPQTLPSSGPLTISFAADKGKRSTARTRGLRVRVRCSVQCKATATAKVDKKVAKALRLGKKALTIGKAKASITRPGRIPFFIKLNAKTKRALARKGIKKFKVKLAIAVTDSSGKQLKRGTKTITLR
jgi:hypothetical protein